MVRVFCCECDKEQATLGQNLACFGTHQGWWVGEDGDLFTDCETCGDTFPAYIASRFLDGRDLPDHPDNRGA
jgi:hypothetical protein